VYVLLQETITIIYVRKDATFCENFTLNAGLLDCSSKSKIPKNVLLFVVIQY